MKLLKTKTELVEARSVTGLLTCTIKHAIKETTAVATYDGPYMPKAMWLDILAFLRWVNDTTKSEGQVRLYVNMKEKTWKAWAYPQEAKTGMSARELDNEDTKKQREQFKDSEGWLYFGTVHSHCSMSAFQSSTDEANETNQDGLHITVGHLDKDHFDLHSRFYRSLMKFEPDLSEFWDIGEPWASSPFVDWQAAAKWQMEVPPPKDHVVPEAWKANLIEIKPVEIQRAGFTNGAAAGSYYSGHNDTRGEAVEKGHTKKEMKEIRNMQEWKRRELCAKEIEAAYTVAFGGIQTRLIEMISFLADDETAEVLKCCRKYNVDPEDLDLEFRFGQGGNPQYGLPATGIGSMLD